MSMDLEGGNSNLLRREVSQVPCTIDVQNTFDGVYAHVDLATNTPVGPGDVVQVLGDRIIAPYGAKFTLSRMAEVTRAGRIERAITRLVGRLECLELFEVSFSSGECK